MKKNIIFTAMAAILLITSIQIFSQENILKIYVPKAPPSIPLLMLEKKGYDIEIVYYNDVTTEVLPKILKNEKSLYIIPTNVSAKLYNKSGKITQLSIASLGMIKIITTSMEIKTIRDLDKKEIHIPAPGSSPDVIARYLFSKNDTAPVIKYGSTPEITQLMLAGKIESAVLPEPMASMIVTKNPNARIISNAKTDWSAIVKGSSGIPQVGICGETEYVKTMSRQIKLFLNDYGKAVKKVNSNAAEAAVEGKNKLEITLPDAVIIRSIPEMNLVHLTGNEAYNELVKYFEVLLEMDASSIGDKIPDRNFMMK